MDESSKGHIAEVLRDRTGMGAMLQNALDTQGDKQSSDSTLQSNGHVDRSEVDSIVESSFEANTVVNPSVERTQYCSKARTQGPAPTKSSGGSDRDTQDSICGNTESPSTASTQVQS